MSRDRKNIILINSPLIANYFIPVGICGLKSYINKELNNVETYILDLNIIFYRRMLTKLRECSYSFCNKCLLFKKCTNKLKKISKQDIVSVIEIYQNIREDKSLFNNYDTYSILIDTLDEFIYNVIFCLTDLAKEYFSKKQDAILDFFDKLFETDIKRILNFSPDLVGISIIFESQFIFALLLAKLLKRHAKTPIVLGGAYISLLDVVNILRSADFIDFIIYNEGELGLKELIKNIHLDSLSNVPNLVYRKNGRIIKNPPEWIQNLDLLPSPDLSNLKLNFYPSPVPVVSIGMSRGCYWRKCYFCIRFLAKETYRIKTTTHFIKEIQYCLENGIDHFMLSDEIITAKKLNELSDALRKNKLNIKYGFLAKPGKDFKYSILKKAYATGLKFILWGLESGSQHVTNCLMNKGINIKDTSELFQNCYRIGIRNVLFIIPEYPGQSKKDIVKNKYFLLRHNRYVDGYALKDFWIGKDSFIAHNPDMFDIDLLSPGVLVEIDGRKIYGLTINFKYRKGYIKNNLNGLLPYIKTFELHRRRWEYFLIHINQKQAVQS